MLFSNLGLRLFCELGMISIILCGNNNDIYTNVNAGPEKK